MSPKLPHLKPGKVVAALKRAGFYEHHATGSHVQLKHRDLPELRVTVPVHSKTLKMAVLKSILKQANLSLDELNDLL